MGLCQWFLNRHWELSQPVGGLLDGGGGGGRGVTCLGEGDMGRGEGGGGTFHPQHGGVLLILRSASAVAFRQVPLVVKSYASGQKPQPLSHMLEHTRNTEEMKYCRLQDSPAEIHISSSCNTFLLSSCLLLYLTQVWKLALHGSEALPWFSRSAED